MATGLRLLIILIGVKQKAYKHLMDRIDKSALTASMAN